MFHSIFAAGFQQVERAIDIGAHIQTRIGYGRPNSGAGGEMEDLVELMFSENRVDQLHIANVAFDQRDALTDGGDIGVLDGWVVEIVEVIDHDHISTTRQEGFAEVRANEAGAAGD